MRSAIVSRPLDASALLAEVSGVANGASIIFVGTVRNVNEGSAVTGIEYAAYVPMAEREMAAIVAEAAERFNTADIVVEHRLGQLSLEDASVVIAVSHARRAAAFDASRYIIEELKRRVPIWKREEYVDGTREWIDPTGTERQQEAGNRKQGTARNTDVIPAEAGTQVSRAENGSPRPRG